MHDTNIDNTYENLILELAKCIKFCKADDIEWIEPIEKPQVDISVQFKDLSKEDTLKILKRKKLWNLAILKPFVDVMKYKTSSKKPTILSISCNANFWKIVYKKHQYASRAFQLAQELELIKCVNSKYRFNSNSNYSKLYAYNKKQEKVLLALFKEYNITDSYKQNITSYNLNTLSSVLKSFNDTQKAKDFEEANRRFNIRITPRTSLPLKDDVILKGIYERYPQYREMAKTISQDNRNRPLDELDYANINISRDKNGNAISISCRKTNSLCPLKVHDLTEEDLESKRTRDQIITEKFGGVYENDVKSSIYRITHLLNKGVWLDESIDLYEMIYGSKFKSQEDRNLFKSPLCMQLYFNTSTRQMKSHIEYRKQGVKDFMKYYEGITLIEKARDNMFKAIGKSYSSEIFLHESCIYTQVAHRMRNMGYQVIQIYDGFFTDKPFDSNTFRSLVKSEAMRYYRKYYKSIHNINNKNNHNHNHKSNINNKHNIYINSAHIREIEKEHKKLFKELIKNLEKVPRKKTEREKFLEEIEKMERST